MEKFMKNFIKIIFAFCCLVFPFALAGCNPNTGCKGNGVWRFNTESHWQQCQDVGCPKKVEYGEHSLDDSGLCKCGYHALAGATYTYLCDGKYEITDFDQEKNKSENITINSTYNDGTHGEGDVVSVGERAFNYNSKIKTLTLPNTITTIKDMAFLFCDNLETVTWSNTLQKIGDSAFKSTNFTNLELPESVTQIGESAFESCSNLTSVKLPSGVTQISDSLFAHCNSLTQIELSNLVTKLGKEAFANCESLESFPLNNLTELTTIGESCFFMCNEMSIDEQLPDSLTSIGKEAFSNCCKIEKISLPSNIKKIEELTFSGCDIEQISFGTNIKSFGEEALKSYNTDSASKVPLKIYYDGELSDWTQIKGLDGLLYDSTYNQLFIKEQNEYKEVTNASLSAIFEIKPYAFYKMSSLTRVSLSSLIKEIGEGAFAECENLSQVIIYGNDELVIGENAFYNCDALDTLAIENAKEIKEGAFVSCGKLKFIYINTQSIWSKIIKYEDLRNQTTYQKSDTYNENCWHYVDGVPTLWAQ